MKTYINGNIVPAQDARVSVLDRGFMYGDGAFESMRAYNGVVLRIDEHMARLMKSLSILRINLPFSDVELENGVYETLAANGFTDAFVRLTVTRGIAEGRFDPEPDAKPTIVITAKPYTPYPASYYEHGVRAIIAKTVRNLKESLDPQVKSLNFLNNILARIEASDVGAMEALMVNSNGHLTEGAISNLFFFQGKRLCTPSCDCGLLQGITRDMIIEIARGLGIDVYEGKFYPATLYKATEVFITNTTLEVLPVSSVNGVAFAVGDMTKQLRSGFSREINRLTRS